MKGMIEVYCGDGKGKTTAALGLALRATGFGLKVYMLQFLKSNDCSEHNAVKGIKNLRLETVADKVKFVFMMNEQEKEENRKLNEAKFDEAVRLCQSGEVDVMIFDEIIGCVNCGQLGLNKVIDFLVNKPENLEIVLTGRDPDKSIVELADYVSEVKKIKHPYDKGVNARKGIEF